jgi:predicted ATP-dependent protease
MMEKKKEKILLLSLKRQQAAEDQRRVKEYELQRRKDEEAAKAEEKERKKEDEKARKQAILESYRLKKQEELEPVSIFCAFVVSAICISIRYICLTVTKCFCRVEATKFRRTVQRDSCVQSQVQLGRVQGLDPKQFTFRKWTLVLIVMVKGLAQVGHSILYT